MIRGGSWRNNARNCRSAYRNRNDPENRNNNLGFRLARSSADKVKLCQTEPAAFRAASCAAKTRPWPSCVSSNRESSGRPFFVQLLLGMAHSAIG